jgi:hypothetical protein
LVALPLSALAISIVWDTTRYWTPLDFPISLTKGQIRTPEFEINVNSSYSVGLGVEFNPSVETSPCAAFSECLDKLSTVIASWELTRDGQVVVRGRGAADGYAALLGPSQVARPWGRFHARPGRYVLEVEVIHDASGLTAASPHILVYESGGAKSKSDARLGIACLSSFLLNPIGLSLLLLAAINRRESARFAFLAAHPLTQPGMQSSAPAIIRLRPVYRKPYGPRPQTGEHGPLYPRLSTVSLITVLVLLMVAVPIWTEDMNRPPTVGLPVRLYNPRPQVMAINTGIQPLRVRVERNGIRVALYGNWLAVTHFEFEAVLRNELKRRSRGWPVYVEGDPSLMWMDVVKVIDTIEGSGGSVMLLKSPEMP